MKRNEEEYRVSIGESSRASSFETNPNKVVLFRRWNAGFIPLGGPIKAHVTY